MAEIKQFPNSDPLYERTSYSSQQEQNQAIPVEIELTGGLGYMQEHFYKNSIYPDRATAGLAALCTLAGIAGHNNFSPTGLKLNLYTGFVLPSGWGKDRLKDGTYEILRSAGLERRIISQAASRPAMHMEINDLEVKEVIKRNGLQGDEKKETAIELIENGKGCPITPIIIADEFHSLLQADEKSPWKLERRDFLLEAYTANYPIRPVKSVNKTYPIITKCHLNVIGYSTPKEMAKALGNNSAGSGLVGRFMFMTMQKMPKKNYANMKRKVFCGGNIHSHLMSICDCDPRDIPWALGGEEFWQELDEKLIEPMKQDEEHGEIANRLSEQVIKMATLLALDENPENPAVTAEHVNQAWAIRYPLHHNFLIMVREEGGLGASEHQAALQKTATCIYNWNQKQWKAMPISKLKERCAAFRKLPIQDQERVIKALEVEGKIMATPPPGVTLLWVEERLD